MIHRRAGNKSPLLDRERLADVFWVVIALVIIVAGALGFGLLGALRTPVEAVPVVRTVPLVETAIAQWHGGSVPVSGKGFIRPAQQVELSVEISGRVMSLHPAVQSRGRVSEGEIIARLDDRAAKASLERARSDIDSTQAQLNLNRTQLERARALKKRGVITEDELDRRLAEEATLKASLASLSSALESARVALDATRIKAPFDGQVLEKHAELGAVLNPGQPVVTLFTPDLLEVSVALEESEAALIPGLFESMSSTSGEGPGQTSNTEASVSLSFAGKVRTWPASIQRIAPTLSARTRTLGVTVRLDQSDSTAGAAPVLINAWANVEIAGRSELPVLAVPSEQIRPADSLWLVVEGKLRIVDVSIVQVNEQISYVSLDESVLGTSVENARLVTSVLATPVHGMPVQLVDFNSAPDVSLEARALEP